MSEFSIKQYQTDVERIIHFGGTKKETAIRNAFYNLLNEYAKQKGLMIVAEVTIKAVNSKRNVTPDGTLKDVLRQDWGYWESKDESDDIDEEIKKKFDKGYPRENILFEDSQTAVLFHNGIEVQRVAMKDAEKLHQIITSFINYERPEVRHFRQAIELFKQDIPKVTETLRKIIDAAEKSNKEYKKLSKKFLKLCHDSINPNVTEDDVREMIIQHILTEDVFNTIFDENQFHRENNIARELESVIHTFFTGTIRKTALSCVQHYYQAINAAAAGIADHHEKQKFLKVIYETFYKSYNPKAADRLGVVYTPNELVHFMIKSTDYLLHKHFNKFLEDKNVEILDPATGTGTFICDIIDYIRKDKLEYKYKNELHANEIAILPYYISNLNIEFTYTQKMGQYSEFNKLCFVDTLDNMGFNFTGKQTSLFTPFSEENSLRILKQNSRKISVVIGNPPYNANQLNENENNKNREYPEIDKRIKETFIKYSTAQKTKVYDMYARFYRWAFDRLQDNGIVAFVTNRSFIDSRTFDGFRKVIQTEFDFAYIIDTKSDVRANPKIAGTTHNIFGIQTGVAVMFLVKKSDREKNAQCNIQYFTLSDDWRKEEKLQWFTGNQLNNIPFTHIQPDKNNNWINLADNDFETLLPLVNKLVKAGHSKKAIFQLFSNGIVTARDEWTYDFSKQNLSDKVRYFCDFYSSEQSRWQRSDKKTPINDFVKRKIKFGSEIENHLVNGSTLIYDEQNIIESEYRPFISKNCYFDKIITHRIYQNKDIFGFRSLYDNKVVCFSGIASTKPFSALITTRIFSYDFIEKTQCLPLYRFDQNGNRTDNITDWGLNQFTKHYKTKKITKEDIFNYVYAVLHNPIYKNKYELNLKREFPRIPFYDDFNKWAAWGKALMVLHINYETTALYPLKRVDIDEVFKQDGTNTSPTLLAEPVSLYKAQSRLKVKLKANKPAGIIELDEQTILTGVPAIAWEYKLGNRSALEWILDQYKEKKHTDPTITEKFNTYRFADYKEQIIDLLMRVCMVSVETTKIINEMTEYQVK
jgi:predicted helicase